MTELLLLRHGLALDPEEARRRGLSDAERPLTEKGRRRCRLAARGLARWLESVPRVLTSPLPRARETAEIFADALGAELEVVDWLRPGVDPQAWFAKPGGGGDHGRVMWVGHEPQLSRAVALAIGDGGAAVEMKKSACAAIRFPDLPTLGGGELAWLLPPRLLRLLGGE